MTKVKYENVSWSVRFKYRVLISDRGGSFVTNRALCLAPKQEVVVGVGLVGVLGISLAEHQGVVGRAAERGAGRDVFSFL